MMRTMETGKWFVKTAGVLAVMTINIGVAVGQDKTASDRIRINQIGYYPLAKKVAVVVSEKEKSFYIATADGKSKVYSAALSASRQSPFSSKQTQVANFSGFQTPGRYVLVVPAIGQSYPFEIKPDVHDAVSRASIKAFYFQRVSTPLPEKFAGQWHRAAGHPDDNVIIHPSAASATRPAGSVISASKGWYDAGDYNKYMVNSGITMGTLLSAYENFPDYYSKLNLNIPESNNSLPDLLDEVLWNLRWMMAMQDNDGGVYNKLTNPKFDGMIMPDKAKAPRYVVQKGTTATLDFAAVMAQSSRVFSRFSKELPDLADSCMSAATKAWAWAIKNPSVEYDQNTMNKEFDPDISTGGYGDKQFDDEFTWAACELYATTKDKKYVSHIQTNTTIILPSWSNVRLLGFYTLLRLEKQLPESAATIEAIKQDLVSYANGLLKNVEANHLACVMGGNKKDFIWGSSSVAANQAILLINAFRISNDKKYLEGALSNLDYLLGRNGTGYSFVTGHGDKTPMHPHHRPSIADGVAEPIPGLLSGGPNPGMQDKCTYASAVADEAFADDDCSYASNEIAINWNAPLVYLLGSMEALQATLK